VDKPAANTIAVATAGHPHKFQANHGEGRARHLEFIVKSLLIGLVQMVAMKASCRSGTLIAGHDARAGRHRESCRATMGSNPTVPRLSAE
jgi:hypothetical protein